MFWIFFASFAGLLCVLCGYELLKLLTAKVAKKIREGRKEKPKRGFDFPVDFVSFADFSLRTLRLKAFVPGSQKKFARSRLSPRTRPLAEFSTGQDGLSNLD
jgi:hypothetical protein